MSAPEPARARDASPRFLVLLALLTSLGLTEAGAGQEDAFLLAVEDVFSIRGVGTVVTGRVERGSLAPGIRVELVGPQGNVPTVVTRIERGRQTVQTAGAGDDVGLALRGMDRDAVARGMVVAAPGSIRPRGAVRVRVEPLSSPLPPDRHWDGRSGSVQVYARTMDVGVRWFLPEGTSSMPTGTPFDLVLDLARPWPLDVGQELVFRQGGRSVGTAVVEEILF